MERTQVNFETAGRNTVAHFCGEIDEHSAKSLRDTLDKRLSNLSTSVVVFDFSEVNFVDSTGLGLILGRYKLLRERGVELVLSSIPPQVDRVFKASGVYSVCPKIG